MTRRVRAPQPLNVADETEWNAFVAAVPGGLYHQSSYWAKVKARAGWRASHVVVDDGAGIVAGAQLLLRPLPGVGSLGYVPKGPLVPADDPELVRLLLDALLERAASCRVRYLALQPPNADETLERELAARGFEPAADIGTPSTTLRIDLAPSAEDLMADMNKWTRRNIRRGQSHGVTVRTGSDADLDAFLNLRKLASERKGFAIPAGTSYYVDMWRFLREGRNIELFLAEYDNELVSAMLAITFGDTVFAHASAWTGDHGSHKPNEVLEWGVITWAREHGYKCVDMDGIDPRIADAIRGSGAEPLDESSDIFVTRYKLGFGGQVSVLPGGYEYIPSGPVRWAYGRIYPAIRKWGATRTVRKALRHGLHARNQRARKGALVVLGKHHTHGDPQRQEL